MVTKSEKDSRRSVVQPFTAQVTLQSPPGRQPLAAHQQELGSESAAPARHRDGEDDASFASLFQAGADSAVPMLPHSDQDAKVTDPNENRKAEDEENAIAQDLKSHSAATGSTALAEGRPAEDDILSVTRNLESHRAATGSTAPAKGGTADQVSVQNRQGQFFDITSYIADAGVPSSMDGSVKQKPFAAMPIPLHPTPAMAQESATASVMANGRTPSFSNSQTEAPKLSKHSQHIQAVTEPASETTVAQKSGGSHATGPHNNLAQGIQQVSARPIMDHQHSRVDRETARLGDNTGGKGGSATAQTHLAVSSPRIPIPIQNQAAVAPLETPADARREASFSPLLDHAVQSAEVSSTTTQAHRSLLSRTDLPAHIARQLADALQQMPTRPVEISLNPDELGKVRLSFAASDTAITLTVLAERPETLDLMRRHIDQLAKEFQTLGYQDIAFSFSGADTGASDGQSDPEPIMSSPLAQDADGAAPSATQIHYRVGAAAGLDLRL